MPTPKTSADKAAMQRVVEEYRRAFPEPYGEIAALKAELAKARELLERSRIHIRESPFGEAIDLEEEIDTHLAGGDNA